MSKSRNNSDPSRRLSSGVRFARGFLLLFVIVAAAFLLAPVAGANGDDDHSAGTGQATAPSSISMITAERNIQNDGGQFTIVLKRSPGDPRVGETQQVLVALSEKVEGGFGSGPLPIEKASVSFDLTQPDGTVVIESIAATEEAGGLYRGNYKSSAAGDYKLLFKVVLSESRGFSADFPVTVARAPVRMSFWGGLFVLLLLTGGAVGFFVYTLKKRNAFNFRRIAPVTLVALVVFIVGALMLAFLIPPTQTREAAAIPTESFTAASVNTLPVGSLITVPKESQLLFG
ncbi:MAG: hypothetical protein WBO10_15100, partial [Pyrinomonadaceae bacterium]